MYGIFDVHIYTVYNHITGEILYISRIEEAIKVIWLSLEGPILVSKLTFGMTVPRHLWSGQQQFGSCFQTESELHAGSTLSSGAYRNGDY